MNDEWLTKNFRAIKLSVEKLFSQNDKRQNEIKALQKSIAMLIQENQTIKQRLNLMQTGKVLGSTEKSDLR